MQIQTLSAVIGTQACDAGCPFCVSAMTGFDELPKGCPIDRQPTLYPFEVTEYRYQDSYLLRGW